MYEDTRLPCTLCLAPPGSPRPIGACPGRRQRGGRAETGDADADPRRYSNPAEPAPGCAKGGRGLRVPGRPLNIAGGRSDA